MLLRHTVWAHALMRLHKARTTIGSNQEEHGRWDTDAAS
jgi:hypothetical protein